MRRLPRGLASLACLASLVASLTTLAACGVVLGPDRDSSLALFDEFWGEFDRHYAFFELKHIDWNGVRDVFRPQAASATTSAELAAVLGRMIDTLNDVHVSLTTPTARFQSGDSALVAETNYLDLVVQLNYVLYDTTPSKRIGYGTIQPGIGYMRIESFSGSGWGQETDFVLRELSAYLPLRGLIIDVRDNGGGNDSNAREIAARFTDERRPYAYVQYRNGPAHTDFSPRRLAYIDPARVHFSGGPVVVLTNRKAFSATEHFALMMRAIPGVVLLGDTTGGASGNPLQRELSNGWIYQLSESIAYDLEGKPFEEVGIAPDVVVKQGRPGAADATDDQIDAALLIINSALPSAASSSRALLPPH